MNDLWKQQLGMLAELPTDDEVEAALRSVTAGSRRRKALATVGVAAATTAVVGAAVLVTRASDSDDDVSTGPSGQDRNDQPTTTAVPEAGSVLTDGQGEGDGFPWTTSTTTPGGAPTPEQVSAIEQQLSEADQDLVRGWGMGQRTDGSDVYLIDLRADAVDLAGELWEEWGSLVEINLGFRVYPTGDPSPYALAECPAPQAATQMDTGLTGTLTLAEGGEVVSGSDIEGVVTVSNTTDQPLYVRPTFLNNVTRPGDDEVAGVSNAVVTASLEAATEVPPGGTAEVDVVFGTTNCGPDGPPGVAPGTYDAVARVSQVDGELGETIISDLLVRAPVTVTAAG
jgi:hypothetical protein